MLYVVHAQCFFAVFKMFLPDFFCFFKNCDLHVKPFGYRLTRETLSNGIRQKNVLSCQSHMRVCVPKKYPLFINLMSVTFYCDFQHEDVGEIPLQ